jgi:hypothetical protein
LGLRFVGALMLAIGLASCGGDLGQAQRRIGISTSLPILWGESSDPKELLSSGAPPSWAGSLLAEHGQLTPLDTLVGVGGRLPLPTDALLVMIQPHALSPQENVALDAWVRSGGHLLLFADPMLTQPSRYPLGDPRRPADMAMLSPILAHWGLELAFDPAQPAGEYTVRLREGSLPVNLPGRFHLLGNSGDGFSHRGNYGIGASGAGSGKDGDGMARCRLESSGVLASCVLGKGRILALADAALFEEASGDVPLSARRNLFSRLLSRAESGD